MQMFYKNDKCIVEVYHFFENKTALIFSPHMASKQNGFGWVYAPMKNLIPLEYYNEHKDNCFISKSERNKIKERLALTKAEWTCTDGFSFNSCDEAINHEMEIMKNLEDIKNA